MLGRERWFAFIKTLELDKCYGKRSLERKGEESEGEEITKDREAVSSTKRGNMLKLQMCVCVVCERLSVSVYP